MHRHAQLSILVAAILLSGSPPCEAQPKGPTGNIPVAPTVLKRRLEREPFQIVAAEATEGGVMGAQKLELVFPKDGTQIKVKWKAAPEGGDGWNNSPRREIAAYDVERWFLNSRDSVVPPAVARCIPLDVYRPIDPQATPNVEGAQCVFGALTVWLDNVTQPNPTFDRERFSTDERYAYHFANLNLLAYLIGHRDARANNFLISKDPANPQLFSIDNGIAFGSAIYNFFTWHFDEIAVRGLPAPSVDRLRHLDPAAPARLGVVAELHADEHRVLQHVEPGPNAGPDEGVRKVPGGIQLGLTAEEIAAIVERRDALLRRVDAGELVLFAAPEVQGAR